MLTSLPVNQIRDYTNWRPITLLRSGNEIQDTPRNWFSQSHHRVVIKQARARLTRIHTPAPSSVDEAVSNKKSIPPSAAQAEKDETVSSCLPLKIDLRALWLHISRVIARAFCPVSARSAQIPQTTAGFIGWGVRLLCFPSHLHL